MNTDKIREVLNAFEIHLMETENNDVLELLMRTVNDDRVGFVERFLKMFEHDNELFDRLDLVESERLGEAIAEFGEKMYNDSGERLMDEFANFLENEFGCDNAYVDRDETLLNVFNRPNHTGYPISTADIFELTDDKYGELKNHILTELCVEVPGNIEEGDEEVETHVTFLPKAWAYSFGFFLADFSYLIDEDIFDTDPEKYTPVVVDTIERRVYFSLQGDRKILFDPETYTGYLANYLEERIDETLTQEELDLKYPRRTVHDTDAYRQMAIDNNIEITPELAPEFERIFSSVIPWLDTIGEDIDTDDQEAVAEYIAAFDKRRYTLLGHTNNEDFLRQTHEIYSRLAEKAEADAVIKRAKTSTINA